MDLSGIEFPLKRDDGGYLGMTTLQEQVWCKDYATKRFTGKGALVELGTFFGSLTLPLAEGLLAAVEAGRITEEQARIHAYDLYYWHKSMVPNIKDTPLEGLLKEGDWFFEVFKANTRHVESMLEVTWGDLGKKIWEGGPIEFLLLDCLKYDAITNNVLQSFFPATRPGLSRIAHQDYFHFYEWWTHLINFEQRDLLAIEEAVPESGMLIMRVDKPLDDYVAGYDPRRDFSRTSPDAIEEAYEWNFSVIPETFHAPLHAARIWAYIWTGNKKAARKLYAEAQSRFGDDPSLQDLTAYCRNEGYDF